MSEATRENTLRFLERAQKLFSEVEIKSISGEKIVLSATAVFPENAPEGVGDSLLDYADEVAASVVPFGEHEKWLAECEVGITITLSVTDRESSPDEDEEEDDFDGNDEECG